MTLPTFNVPPIGPKQGKLWGKTQLVFAFNSTEAHGITVNKGGYCSKHLHKTKWNRFLVLQGELLVRIFFDKGVDETIIGPGGVTDVPPGVLHQFEALSDVLAVEFYWVPLEAGDIERPEGNVGGMNV